MDFRTDHLDAQRAGGGIRDPDAEARLVLLSSEYIRNHGGRGSKSYEAWGEQKPIEGEPAPLPLPLHFSVNGGVWDATIIGVGGFCFGLHIQGSHRFRGPVSPPIIQARDVGVVAELVQRKPKAVTGRGQFGAWPMIFPILYLGIRSGRGVNKQQKRTFRSTGVFGTPTK